MQAGLDRDLDLGADAVGGGDQDRVLEAGRLEVEQAAEAADLGVGAGPRGGAHHRLDQIDQPVARVDIDARIGVSEPVLAVGHAQFPVCLRLVTSDSGAAQWLASAPALYYVDNNRFSPQAGRIRGQAGAGKRRVNIPNIITLGRIMLVPIIVWAIASSQMEIAFAVFLDRRRQRCRRRLPRQALQHDERARRPARPARRQGAAGLDLSSRSASGARSRAGS